MAGASVVQIGPKLALNILSYLAGVGSANIIATSMEASPGKLTFNWMNEHMESAVTHAQHACLEMLHQLVLLAEIIRCAKSYMWCASLELSRGINRTEWQQVLLNITRNEAINHRLKREASASWFTLDFETGLRLGSISIHCRNIQNILHYQQAREITALTAQLTCAAELNPPFQHIVTQMQRLGGIWHRLAGERRIALSRKMHQTMEHIASITSSIKTITCIQRTATEQRNWPIKYWPSTKLGQLSMAENALHSAWRNIRL